MKHLPKISIVRAALLLTLLSQAFNSSAQNVTLAEGVDAPGLTWTTGTGNQPMWAGTTNVSHDGVDSATIGPLAVGAGNANLNAFVTGPTFVRFWAKANCDPDNDDFLMRLNNSSLGRFLNRADEWRQDMVFVPAGSATLTWNYYRDVFARKGTGQMWVDQVELVAGNGAPMIYRPPESRTVWRGQGVSHSAGVAGASFLSYRWLSNGVPTSATGIPYNVLATWPPGSPVTFALMVSNSLNVVTSTPAIITTMEPIPLTTALDLAGATWTTGTGNRPPWFGQTNVSMQGGSAAGIGPIPPSNFSELTALLNGPGLLRFLWKIDAADDDMMELISNGTVDFNYRIRDVFGWEERFYFIPSGPRTIGWRFTRDVNSRANQGMAFVDGLQFTPGNIKPLITSPPTNYITPIGVQGNGFRVLTTGTTPISMQWRSNGVPIPGATFSPYYPIDPIYGTNSAQYTVVLSNSIGMTTSSPPVSVMILPPIPFDEALELTGPVWTVSSPLAWYGATNTTSGSGPQVDRAFSPPLPGTPTLSTTINGPARVGFNWQSSYGRLNVKVNGEQQNGSWLDPRGIIFSDTSYLFLSAGSNLVEWIHIPHSNNIGGISIYQMTLDPGAFAPTVLRMGAPRVTFFETPPTNQIVDVGTPATIEVEAIGTAPLSYHWRKNGQPYAATNSSRLMFASVNETNSGTYSVIVSNGVNTSTSGNAQLTVIPITNLIAALDAPGLTWNRSGTAFWTDQTTNTHDGVDAAVNGLITASFGGNCILETTVNGPGRVSFWWKNKGDSFDNFTFGMDGNALVDIDNDDTWRQQIFDVPTNTHTLIWAFDQDAGAGSNPARAFLDQIQYQAGAFAPTITKTNHAASQTLNEGDNLTLYVEAIGTPQLVYRFYRSNVLVSTRTDGFLFLQNIAPFNAGIYTVSVSNYVGSVTGAPSVVQIIAALPLAEATDALELDWSSGGSTRWIGQAALTHDGIDGAASARLLSGNLNSSLFTFVTGPGTLSFWWKLQGEETVDSFDLQIDGVLQPQRLILEQDWSQQSVSITNGFHSVNWIVRAGARFGSPFDPIQGWLDQVDFAPADPRLLTRLMTVTNGQLRLPIAGEVGRKYRVDTSTNLTAWSPQTTQTLAVTHVLHSVNINLSDRARFFRVVPVP